MKKFFNVGFEDIAVAGRRPFGLDELERYPLFAAEFLDYLRRTMPPERHAELVFSIAVTSRRPALPAHRDHAEGGTPGSISDVSEVRAKVSTP